MVKILILGLLDAHVHLSSTQGANVLENAAFLGVTTVLDMATVSPELVESQSNLKGVADIRSSYLQQVLLGDHQLLIWDFQSHQLT